MKLTMAPWNAMRPMMRSEMSTYLSRKVRQLTAGTSVVMVNLCVKFKGQGQGL